MAISTGPPIQSGKRPGDEFTNLGVDEKTPCGYV